MKKNEISEIIGNINEKYVDEAILYNGKQIKIRHNRSMKWISIAACLCFALVGAFAIPKLSPSVSENAEHADTRNENAFHDNDPNSSAPAPDSQTADSTKASEQSITVQDETDTSPVYYSDLKLTNGVPSEEALAFSNADMLSITSFDASALSQDNCCMIVEGTVVNLYVKHYSYDIYNDKFEKNGILHSKTDTIVYEIAVDKTWYGEDISGDTILIEDTSYFTEPIFAVKKGGRYVLPIYEYGDTVWTLGHEYAGGDIARDTVYSTIYPYHPQIEVTNDGSYVVSQDWTTLTAKNAKEIIMDTLEDDDYWKDKMCLVDGKTFEEQMAVLISDIK